jgi:hypothetical protein
VGVCGGGRGGRGDRVFDGRGAEREGGAGQSGEVAAERVMYVRVGVALQKNDSPTEAIIFEPNSELADLVMCHWTLESKKENTPLKNI